MNMNTGKYKLHSQAEGAPCAFFNSSKGCRNGSSCRFIHSDPGVMKVEPVSTDVSSESTDGDAHIIAPHPLQKSQESLVLNQKKRKASDDIFALPKETNSRAARIHNVDMKPSSTSINHQQSTVPNSLVMKIPTDQSASFIEQAQKSSVRRKEELSQEAKDKRSHSGGSVKQTNGNFSSASSKQANTGQNRQQATATTNQKDESIFASPPQNKKKKLSVEASKEEPSPEPGYVNFRQLSLPVTSFAISKKNVSSPSQKLKVATRSESSDDDNDADVIQPLPIPKAPESIKWKSACLKSRAHAKYHSLYNFEKYKSMEAQIGIAKTWIKARPYGAWCRKNPQVIAIDCEMCETTCPLTGIVDGKALCRLSVVNALNADDVLIDTLVKPDWPVSDYRTRIHGIEPSNLDSVAFTLTHAQSFMMALCSEETVIVGHAVHNDLVALKMEHYCVADSSFLFEIKDAPGVTPSLRDLAIRVLNVEMPNIHDSVHDARISLQSLEEGYIKTGGCPSPIERFYPVRSKSDATSNQSSLLIHRIPRICKENHILQLFLSQTNVQPSEIPEIEFVNDKGKVMVSFQSAAHAKLAFDFMPGRATEDKGGRMQKKVYLKNGDYIVVRENSSKNHVAAI